MQLIADRGLKADLHIHSIYSKHKDGAKVNNNSIEKIDLLINKLIENKVNICAITDHDTFNYEIYEKLKQAETSDSSIEKVLPGVEFSVQFSTDNENKVIHIVTIFNDIP
jgi:predicted metal-dependent phosphoesterase TrpH